MKTKKIGFKFYLLLLIFALALFLRLYNLDIIPAGFTHDEVDLAFNAKTFILTGTDQSASWNPLKLQQPITETIMGELVPLINVPLLYFLPLNIFNARLTIALLGSIFVFLIYLISSKLFSNPQISLLISFLYSINPWSIIGSRIDFEVTFSLFFYFLSFYLFLILKEQLLKKTSLRTRIITTFLVCLSLFVAYFSYHGLKFSQPFFVSILITWAFFSSKKVIRNKIAPYFTFILLFSFSLFAFSFFNSSDLSARKGEIILLEKDKYQSASDLERQINLAPPSIQKIFSNRYIIISRDIFRNFINTYNPQLLFLTGEDSDFFAIRTHGYFYIFEIIFIFFGFAYLYQNYRHLFYLWIALLIFIPIPSIIHSGQLSIFYRSASIFLLIIILSGLGLFNILDFINKLSHKNFKSLSIFALIFLISISFFNFFYHYFFYYPMASERAYIFAERLLFRYIDLVSPKKLVVITPSPYSLYRGYLTHRNLINKSNVKSIQSKFQEGPGMEQAFIGDNIIFTKNCDYPKDESETLIYDVNISPKCKDLILSQVDVNQDEDFYKLVSPKDSGSYYHIYEDQICQPFVNRSYVHLSSLSKLRVENQELPEFCQEWVVTSKLSNQ